MFDLLPVAERLHIVHVVVEQCLDRFFVRVDESALHLFLGGLVELLADLVDETEQAAPLFIVAGVFGDPIAQRAQDVDGRHIRLPAFDERGGDAVDDEAGRDAVHALVLILFPQLFHMPLVPVADLLLAVVEFHFAGEAEAGLAGRLEPRQYGKHRSDLQSIGSDMDTGQIEAVARVLDIALPDQLLVDPHLFAHAQVVRHFDHEDAVDHRFVLFAGEVRVVLVFVGVRDHGDVAVDEGEATGLDGLLSGDGVEFVKEPLFGLQHLDELHDAAVGDIEFSVEVVGTGIGLLPKFGERLNIDAAGEFRHILAFGVGGLEGADADAGLLREQNAVDRDVLDFAFPLVVEAVAADGAEIALDVGAEVLAEIGAQLFGDKVQRLLVHGAAFDRVDSADVLFAVALEPTFQQSDQSGLSAADRPDQHQDTLANIEAAGGRVQVLFDQLLQGALQAVELFLEELIAADMGIRRLLEAGRHDHVVDAGMGEIGDMRIFRDQFDVIRKRSFPGEGSFLTALFFHLFKKGECVHGTHYLLNLPRVRPAQQEKLPGSRSHAHHKTG